MNTKNKIMHVRLEFCDCFKPMLKLMTRHCSAQRPMIPNIYIGEVAFHGQSPTSIAGCFGVFMHLVAANSPALIDAHLLATIVADELLKPFRLHNEMFDLNPTDASEMW